MGGGGEEKDKELYIVNDSYFFNMMRLQTAPIDVGVYLKTSFTSSAGESACAAHFLIYVF